MKKRSVSPPKALGLNRRELLKVGLAAGVTLTTQSLHGPQALCGLVEWSLPIDQLGESALYYRCDAQEAKRLLAEAGHPKGFKSQLTWTQPSLRLWKSRCRAVA